MFKKVFEFIGSSANTAWQFLKGKKRLIALAALGLSKLPVHTVLGQTGNFISDNLSNIELGLEITAGLFGATAVAEHSVKFVKEKLPSGLKKKEEKTDETI